MLPTAYHDAIQLIERLHRRFLDVVKLELDKLQIQDINNVQAMILYNIGEDDMTVGELTLRGYYLGSNVSYNVKKMVENDYIIQERSVHDKRPAIGHEGERAEVHLLLDGFNGLFIAIFFATRQAQGRLQGDRVREALVHTLLNRVLRGVELVADKLERVPLPTVFNREMLVKYLLKAFIFSIFRRDVVLHKVMKRLYLDVQKVWIVPHGRNVCKGFARLCIFQMPASGNIPVEESRHKLQEFDRVEWTYTGVGLPSADHDPRHGRDANRATPRGKDPFSGEFKSADVQWAAPPSHNREGPRVGGDCNNPA